MSRKAELDEIRTKLFGWVGETRWQMGPALVGTKADNDADEKKYMPL